MMVNHNVMRKIIQKDSKNRQRPVRGCEAEKNKKEEKKQRPEDSAHGKRSR